MPRFDVRSTKFRLLSGSDTHLRVYDPDTGELLDAVPSSDGGTVLAVAALGEFAVFGGQDGVIHVYSVAARQLVARVHTDAAISALAVEPRRGVVISGDLAGQVSAWSLLGV